MFCNKSRFSSRGLHAFRVALKNFLRFYAYISQIVRMFDTELHNTYLFCEYLQRLLPRNKTEQVNLDDQIVLVNIHFTRTLTSAV